MAWLAAVTLPWLVTGAMGLEQARPEDLWSLKPVVRPAIPQPGGSPCFSNPIDCFLAATQNQLGLEVLGPADRLTWLRRVHMDLTGLPPLSPSAESTVVDRLLASEQHGVRYGRHWLDVLRYADLDEHMPAEAGIHLWRDWVISAVNQDLPYDQFVRAQVCGNRAPRRQIISAAGHLTKVEPRPEDLFAQGFLARGALTRADSDQDLAFAAVDTTSLAFMGMTVGCAKCHDHFYDPIGQKDFYAMKALFDPLVLRPVDLATPAQVFEQGRKVQDHESKLGPLVEAMRLHIEPFHARLYEERLITMPPEVQAAIRKPEARRTSAEQKIYEDYYPILRIDPPKIKERMKPEEIRIYDDFQKQINALKPPEPLPRFWGVAEDAKRASETNFVLITGDPKRPKRTQPVAPGIPFAPPGHELRGGRREAFMDWLAAPENPLFARVAVNRIWAWHFGSPLHASVNDFGGLGGRPVHPALLDWLASEFVARGYSMKWLHRLITTSATYRRSSAAGTPVGQRNLAADPENRTLWRFPLRRLEAEPIQDSLLAAAELLDLSPGGPGYTPGKDELRPMRRAAYMARGYRSSSEAMPESLEMFDAEDGRTVCGRRTETVTPTQALYLMNHDRIEAVSTRLAARLAKACPQDLPGAVRMGYRLVIGRPPTDAELSRATEFLGRDEARLKDFAWMLVNLDEFLYVR